jgi:type I restriction enzyme S subunit
MNSDSESRFPQVRLADFASVVRGSSPRPAGDPRFFNGNFLPWITVADLTSSDEPTLTSTLSRLTEEGAERTRIFEPGTVLLTNSGATLGVPKICGIRAGANDGIAGFLNLSAELDSFFLYYCLSSLTEYFRTKVASGVGQPNLNTELIGDVHVPRPQLNVQQAVVRVLTTWDRGIRQLTDLIAAKVRFKQGLMQQLLTGKRRFPKFKDSSFIEFHVGDVLKETFRPVAWNDDELYQLASIRRHSGGLFWREALLGKQIKVKKLHSLEEGDFLISHIQAAYGAMGLVPAEFANGKVSDMYTILTPRSKGTIDMRYIDYLSQMKRMRHQAYLACNGFFAERLRLNFDPAEFMKQKILLPECIEEQSKISDLLDTLVKEIRILENGLEALKQQKKGLMQKLLTGEVRVKP